MDETNKTEKQPVYRKIWRSPAAVAIAGTIVAWVTMMLNPYVSFWCAVGGVIVAIVSAVRVGKGVWRDIAIACAVACGILVMVFLGFHFAIKYLIDSI